MSRYRLPVLVLALFAITIPAAAGQAHAGKAVPKRFAWTGTITLTNNSTTSNLPGEAPEATLEQHVNLTWKILGYSRTTTDPNIDFYYARVFGNSTKILTQPFGDGYGCKGGHVTTTTAWSGSVDLTPAFVANARSEEPLSFSSRRTGPGRVRLYRAYPLHAGVTELNTCDGSVNSAGQTNLWEPAQFNGGTKPKGTVTLANGDVYTWNLKWALAKPLGHGGINSKPPRG